CPPPVGSASRTLSYYIRARAARGWLASLRLPLVLERCPRHAHGLTARQVALIRHERGAFWPQLLEILGTLQVLRFSCRCHWPATPGQHPRGPGRADILVPIVRLGLQPRHPLAAPPGGP